MNHLAITPLLAALLAAVVPLLLGRIQRVWRRRINLWAVMLQIALALALLLATSGGNVLVYAVGNWPAPFGIVLVVDRLAVWMLIITAVLALCALLHAIIQDEDKAGPHFHTLFQFQLFGLNGAFLTGDLFNLFVFFEVLLLASYGLLLHGGGAERTRAGLHFVVVNLLGSTVFLFAVGTLYGLFGALNLADLARKALVTPPENVALARSAGLLLFGVFALKAALLPFSLWLPAAYGHSSAAVAALFAIMTKVGVYSILRVYSVVFGPQAGPVANVIEPWLMPLALATLIVGMLGVMAATSLRQQAAYLVVSSVGFLWTALGLYSAAGFAAGLYYLPHTTFATAALFLLADLIRRRRGEWADRLQPGPALANTGLLGGLFFITAIAIVGLPPLSGFMAKFLLLRAALAHPLMPWILALVLGAGFLGILALARTGSLLFYQALPPVEGKMAALPARPWELLPVVALLLLGVALTIGSGAVFEQTQAIADQLMQPQLYINAVLHSEATP